MITKEYVKRAIEQAEYNCSGEEVSYEIDEIQELSEEGAYLVIAHSDDCTTSFVAYEDGTCYFLDDWQGDYPKTQLGNNKLEARPYHLQWTPKGIV